MKKQIMTLIAFAICATAHAGEKEISYKNLTVDGKRSVVAIGSCSFPGQDFTGNIVSTGSYTVCQEKVTSQYKVTGSGWGSSKEIVPGTSTSTFVLETKQVQGTVYVQAQNGQSKEDATIMILNDALQMAQAKSQCNDQLRNLSGLRVSVSQTQCANQ